MVSEEKLEKDDYNKKIVILQQIHSVEFKLFCGQCSTFQWPKPFESTTMSSKVNWIWPKIQFKIGHKKARMSHCVIDRSVVSLIALMYSLQFFMGTFIYLEV